MQTKAREDLEYELQDPEFRRLYGAAEAKSELAVAVADARHNLGLTQEEVSEKVGVSQPYIAKLESGEANPTVGAIGSMLAILNLRLKIGTASLLPKPVSIDTFFSDATSGYESGGATGGLGIMAAHVPKYSRGGRQLRTLFHVRYYDSFTPLDEAVEPSPEATMAHSLEEANVGGQRA